MKKLFACLFFIGMLSNLFAQQISVKSFRKLETDLDARVYNPKKDQNGDVCAIIKVVTTQTGFTWDPDGLGIMAAVAKVGEYWLYVPYGAKRLSIHHPQLGILRDYIYPLPIEKATVYEMVLTTGKVTTKVEEAEIESQWLIINSEPSDADVYINNQAVGKTPYQNELPVGKYSWRIQKDLYINEAGVVELVKGGEKQRIDVNLKLNFGYLDITSLPESGATVKLNGIPTGQKTPCKLENIPVGEHTLSVNLDMYEPASQRFSLGVGETKPIVFNLNPIFGKVNVTADSLADIYVNGQFKAKDSWHGRLTQGVYTFEAKKEKYTSDIQKKTLIIGDSLNIELHPTPRFGVLKVITKPIDAAIVINGKNIGQSPMTLKNILIGEYEVELTKQGYLTSFEKVTITEGQTTTLNLKLNTARSVTIDSKPTDADLFIDNRNVGKTPFTGTLISGNHDIRVELYELKTEKTISIPQSGGDTNFELIIKAPEVTMEETPETKKETIPENKQPTANNLKSLSPDTAPYLMNASKPGKPKKPTNGFLIAEIAYPLIKGSDGSIAGNSLCYNFKFGVARNVGFYAGVTTCFNEATIDYTGNNLPSTYYSKSISKSSYNRLGVVGGLVFNTKPLALFAGAGFGYYNHYVTTELYNYSNDSYAKTINYGDRNSYTGIETEIGLVFKSRPMAFSLGITSIDFKYGECKLGLGIVF
ncbi:MAG: PEGA domain-containing protein [Paludibacter sp.]